MQLKYIPYKFNLTNKIDKYKTNNVFYNYIMEKLRLIQRL